MTALRTPTVGGLAGGVGTSTVARALRGRDLGPVGGRVPLPDVVVCTATVSALDRAARLLPEPGGPDRPVLAVTVHGPQPLDEPLSGCLARCTGWSARVLLPRVERWSLVADPLADAPTLLSRPARELPDGLGDYAAALGRLAAALAAGGRLRGGGQEPEGQLGALRAVRGVRLEPWPPAPQSRTAPWTVPAAVPDAGLVW